MADKPIRVLVVDDHAIARSGIRLMLADAPDITVIGEAKSAYDAMPLIAAADVAIVDISMPGKSGLDLLCSLRQQGSPVQVIILSLHAENMYGIRAIELGAVGYLSKDVSIPDLTAAVRIAAAGGCYFSPELAQLLARRLRFDGMEHHHRLSDREFEVMRRLALGESLGMIGKALFLSPKTVSTYRTRVLRKMALTCNAQLTRYAIAQGFI